MDLKHMAERREAIKIKLKNREKTRAKRNKIRSEFPFDYC